MQIELQSFDNEYYSHEGGDHSNEKGPKKAK